MSKAGLVVIAFKKIQGLPQRKKDSARIDKLLKFEKGISEYFQSTMRRSYVAIKNELDEGQAIKKRAVIQMINVTSGGRKKLFNRWQNMTEKQHLLTECRLVQNLFAALNFAIKSISDNTFLGDDANNLKERALHQLFNNLSVNLSTSLKRWRDVNQIEKIREKMT